ncbi:MAG: hypothetical protein MMC33_010656 [Icmadophila ericetorum]|nr:hypothetical protein [Icmadophila ericetorum]
MASSFQLPALPSTFGESLTKGTSIPPPPPSPTRQFHSPISSPIDEKPNPLAQHPTSSNLSLPQTPSKTMPGGFPITPPPLITELPPPKPRSSSLPLGRMTTKSSPLATHVLTNNDYFNGINGNSNSANSSPSTPTGKTSNKRPYSIRKLLSFKSLKDVTSMGGNSTSNDKSSSIFSGNSRPASPSAYSTTSITSNGTSSTERPSLRKKRSINFWSGSMSSSRRKSSLTLDAWNGNGGESREGMMGGNGLGAEMDMEGIENREPERVTSPPPQLPQLEELDAGGYGVAGRGGIGGGFFGGEDMFADIK